MITLKWNYHGRSYDNFPADDIINNIKKSLYQKIQENILKALEPFKDQVGTITLTENAGNIRVSIDDCPDELKDKIGEALGTKN